MYQFTTDDKTYTFPTTFKEIKLGDWQNILTILNSDFNDNKKYLKCISILLGVTEKVLLAMDDDIYIDLWERLNLLCAMKPSGKELNEYQMKDDKLYRITDFNKMTTAEYIDLDTMLKDSDIMWENMHIVMSILWRKKEGKRLAPYDPDIALEMAPKMKLMDVDTVYNSLIFFQWKKQNRSAIFWTIHVW